MFRNLQSFAITILISFTLLDCFGANQENELAGNTTHPDSQSIDLSEDSLLSFLLTGYEAALDLLRSGKRDSSFAIINRTIRDLPRLPSSQSSWQAYQKLIILEGINYGTRQDFIAAKSSYQNAMKIGKENGIETVYSAYHLYGRLANVYSRLGETEYAISLLQRSLKILADSSAHEMYAKKSNDLAIAYQSCGEINKGINTLREGLSFANLPEDIRANILVTLTGLYIDNGDLEIARGTADSARHIYEAELSMNPKQGYGALSTLHWLIGKIESLSDNFSEAEDHFQKAESYYLNTGKAPQNRGYARKILPWADKCLRAGELQPALEKYQSVIVALIPDATLNNLLEAPQASRLYEEHSILEALFGKTQTLHRLYQETGNRNYLVAAAKNGLLIPPMEDLLRAGYTFQGSKLGFAEESHRRTEVLLSVFFDLYHETNKEVFLEQIFSLMDRSQGHLLAETVKKQIVADTALAKLITEEARLENVQTQYERKLREVENDGGDASYWRDQYLLAGSELEEIRIDLKRRYPSDFWFHSIPSILPLSMVTNYFVDSDRSLTSYFLGDKLFFRFHAGENGTAVFRQSNADSIRRLALELKTGISNGDNEFYRKAATELEELLIGSNTKLGFRALVIPDGELWEVPFEAMISSSPSPESGSHPHYLVFDHCFSYTFSATLQYGLEHLQRSEENWAAYSGFFPEFRDNERLGSIAYKGRDGLEQFISDYEGELLIGEEAYTKSVLKNDPPSKILHLVSHAQYDSTSVLNSGIYFEGPQHELRLVNMADIYGGKRKGELAIIEACESEAGEIRLGEGNISLARAFLASGFNGVLSASWQVNQSSTEQIIEEMWPQIAEGSNIDEALRQAKLSYLRSSLVSTPDKAPKYWSGIKPIGKMHPISLRRVPPYAEIAWVAAFAVLLVLTIRLLRQRRSRSILSTDSR